MGFALLVLLTAASSLVLCVLLVPLSKAAAVRFGVVDQPGPRKIHGRVMPRLGGGALFPAFTVVVLAGYVLAPIMVSTPAIRALVGAPIDLLQEAPRVQAKLLAVLGGSAMAFVVGLLDDALGVRFPTWAKLVGQLAAAILLVTADVRISVCPYEWMNVALTVVWLVGVTNAFNLLDNMDGLCAGVAAVASAVFLLNAWSLGEFFITLILAAFIGSLVGFLLFNFQPASVFLGDSGSLFIGFVMGSLTLMERYVSHASSTLFPILMPVVVLAVPLIDTLSVIAIRLREGRPIYVGDDRHLSHRLVALGFSQRSTVLFLYLMTFSLGLGAASLVNASIAQSLLVLLQTTGLVVLLLWLMFGTAGARRDV